MEEMQIERLLVVQLCLCSPSLTLAPPQVVMSVHIIIMCCHSSQLRKVIHCHKLSHDWEIVTTVVSMVSTENKQPDTGQQVRTTRGQLCDEWLVPGNYNKSQSYLVQEATTVLLLLLCHWLRLRPTDAHLRLRLIIADPLLSI